MTPKKMPPGHRVRSVEKGFGLLETLIVLGLVAVVSAGLMGIMTQGFRSQSRIDAKAELQDFGNRLKNLLYDEQACTETLAGITSLTFHPSGLGAFNADPSKSNISLRLGNGQVFSEGAGIDLLRLQLEHEALPEGSGKYEATLISTAPGLSPPQGMRPLTTSLILSTEPAEGGMRRIAGCMVNSLNGTEVCEALGGKWIQSISRCLLGTELTLSQFECLDPSEFDPGQPLEGAVVDDCHYRKGAKILTLNCNNGRDLPLIPQCQCVASGSLSVPRWSLAYPRSGRVARHCDGGVTVRIPDHRIVRLAHNEITEGHFVPEPPAGVSGESVASPVSLNDFLKNYDLLDNVLECYDHPESIRAHRCDQGEKAVRGERGSCIFVNGALARGVATLGELNLPSYTGWMYVTRGRREVRQGVGNNRNVQIAEASGVKCYMVSAVAPPDTLGPEHSLSVPIQNYADPHDPGNANVLVGERWRDASECVFIGGQSASVNPDPLLGANAIIPFPYRGEYLQRYRCEQEDIDPENLTGTNFINPGLRRGTCWYFRDVTIRQAYKKNFGSTSVPGPLGGELVKFTGWMYLTDNLPVGQYEVDSDNAIIQPSHPRRVTPGIPCNAGLRLSP